MAAVLRDARAGAVESSYAFYLLAGIDGLALPFVRRTVEAAPPVRGSILLAGWSLLLQVVHFPRRERWAEAARTAVHRPG